MMEQLKRLLYVSGTNAKFFEVDNYNEVINMREQLDTITSIDTQNPDCKNMNNEAVSIDELTGEVIEIHYDVIAGAVE